MSSTVPEFPIKHPEEEKRHRSPMDQSYCRPATLPQPDGNFLTAAGVRSDPLHRPNKHNSLVAITSNGN